MEMHAPEVIARSKVSCKALDILLVVDLDSGRPAKLLTVVLRS